MEQNVADGGFSRVGSIKEGVKYSLIGISLIAGGYYLIALSFDSVNLSSGVDAFMTSGMYLFGSLCGAMVIVWGLGCILRGTIALICYLKNVDFI